MSNFYAYYKSTVIFKIMKNNNFKSIMQVPNLNKITLNVGIGASSNKNTLKNVISNIELISGQKPIITKARKSIANFKIRKGYPIGCKVTLRRMRMWDFFEKLVLISIPRIRDFRGFSKNSFDGRGNYNIGIKEQIIFPEIDYNLINYLHGLDISISTTANSDKLGYELLSFFKFPFRD